MPAENHAHKHKLKACPFCGSNDLTLDNLADPRRGWYVNCNICEIQQIADHTEAQAVALWNRRTTAVDDALLGRALEAFDTGTGDPNDYRRRMRAALEAALSTQQIT